MAPFFLIASFDTDDLEGSHSPISTRFRISSLWRSLKYEEVYLYAYDTVQMARAGIACYFDFFNDERPHKALGYQTPASFYDGLLGEVA